LHDRVGYGTVRALVVAVLDQRHRRRHQGRRRAEDVVLVRYRRHQPAGGDGEGGRHRTASSSNGLWLAAQAVQHAEDAVRARADVRWVVVAPGHVPVPVQHEQRTLGDALAGPVDAVPARHIPFRLEVSQQGKADAAALGERAVTPYAVDGDTDDAR